MDFATQCIHAGQHPEKVTGAVMTPVFQTSTYAQTSPSQHKGYEYSRTHNPTRTALEESLKALEHAQFAFCFASGCAATSILMLGLNPGDHVIALDDLYGGTRRLFTKVFERFGIKYTFLDLSKQELLAQAITKQTKMIWVESPSNPLLKLVDIKAVSNKAKEHNILVVVDNTFATPALQNPLLLGADIVVHSTTKYIGGHSDVVGGAIMTSNPMWAEKIAFLSNSIGAIPAPWDCFLTLRGIKTLALRMKQHCENASFIYQNLRKHPQINRVYFPFDPEHPQYVLAQSQMKGSSGMISFVIEGNEIQAKKVCENTRLFTCAESLGGVESLIEHPSSMTHASIAKESRHAIGIDDALIRLSVGIEDKNDLWLDLKQAIEK
ncbi:MAG: aminotransferase class V-fold PLP-dependent enzyme [Myxococcales bacterium]|nr:MAG: aminotransferase class V-fold PLP-dependent enzyme [Myxococcales bacterium]